MASNLNGLNFLDRALLGGKFLNRGLQARPMPLGPGPSPAPAGLTTASAQGRGLGFNPLSPGRSAAAGGLQGLSQLLAQLAAGQPQNAAAAFGAGVEGFDEQQARKADRARQDEIYGLELEDRYEARAEKQEGKDAAAAAKAARDSSIDKLVLSGAIDESEGDALKNDVGSLGDFMQDPKAFKPDITEFFGPNNTKFKGYLDESGNVQKVGESAPLYEPDAAPAPTETERLLRLAGIDPASPEGKAIVQKKLQGDGAGGPKQATPKELRDEYTKANKEYEQALYGYGKVVQAAKDPSPAGDIALIFGYMKTLDPGSTVREGEFATAQQAGSVPERITALYNQVLQGTRLTEAQRADFINQAGGQFSVYQNRKSVADKFYSGLAERSGVSPQDVLVPYGDVPQYIPGRRGAGDERNRGSKVIDGVRIERLE